MSNWLLQLQGLSQNRHQWYQDYSHTYAKEYWTTSYLNICFSNNENSNFTGIYPIWYDESSINKIEIHASSLPQNYFIHVIKRVIHGRRKDIVDFRSSKVNHPNNSIQFVCMCPMMMQICCINKYILNRNWSSYVDMKCVTFIGTYN